ncbi:unnamed protein product, partial [Ectocarpus sp. 12 AP-2014]
CEATPASSWWQRSVAPLIFPSQTHRSSFCRDVEKFEACPKYVQELRLIATPATAGGDTTPTSSRAFSSITNEHHSGKGEPHRCSLFLGTIRKGTARAWREISAAAKRVGAVAKCAWSGTNEKVYSAVLTKTGTERKVGGSSCSVVGARSPAQPRKASSHEDSVLAAQRALRGSDTTSGVRLAFGVNTVFFVVAGLRFYLRKSRGGRLRSRAWHRRWRGWQQRGNGGNRRGTVVHGDADNNSSGGSTVGNSPLQSRNSIASTSRRLRAREPCLAWGDWDDASLKIFMAEEARTSRNPAKRLRQVEEFYHRAALRTLARQWNVPFLSKVSAAAAAATPTTPTTSTRLSTTATTSLTQRSRYSHFLQLWEDVCVQTHHGVRDFAFPSKGAVSSARGAFSEVLGEKRPEEQRREKFCELLDVLMKLEPRPPPLSHFLAPWVTESSASSSTTTTGLVGGRRNQEGQHQQEQARGENGASWASTHTTGNGAGGGSESASFGGVWLNGGGSDTRRRDQREQLLLQGFAAGGLLVTPGRPPHSDRSRGSTNTIRQAGVAAATAEEHSAVPLPRDLRLWVFLALVGVLEACAAVRALGVTALSLPVTLVLTAIAPAVAAVAFSVSSPSRLWPSRQGQQERRMLNRPPQLDADSGGVRRRATAMSFGRRPWQPHLLGGVAATAAAAVGLGGLYGEGGGGGGAAVGLDGVGGGGSGGGSNGGGSYGCGGAAAATSAVGLGGRGDTHRRSGVVASSSSPTRGRAPRGVRRRSPARPPIGRRGAGGVNDLGLGLGASSSPATVVGGVRAVAAGVPGGIAQELQME